jgi:hypothetical protein
MKVKRVFVSPELITTMLTTGYVLRGELEIAEGVPPGCALVAVGWDAKRRCYALDFHCETFEWIGEGQEPPILEMHVTRKNPVLADALSE